MKRVLVTGGRNFDDRGLVYRVLDAALGAHGKLVVIEGGATGADALARAWARDRMFSFGNVELITEAADWEDLTAPGAVVKVRPDGAPYNSAAGAMRNHRMLHEHKPDLVFAFPGDRGTKDMLKQAHRARRSTLPKLVILKVTPQ